MSDDLWLTSLTQHIAEDFKNTNKLIIPHSTRNKVEKQLDRILADQNSLMRHIMTVFKLLAPDFPEQEDLTDLEYNAATGDWSQFSDKLLAYLLISPMSLLGIHHQIIELEPAQWLTEEQQHAERHHKRKYRKFCL